MRSATVKQKTSSAERVAMFFGVGIVGLFSGFMFGFALFFLTQGAVVNILGFGVAKFCFVYLPLAMSGVTAVCGLVWPDPTGDFIIRVWRGIASIFQAA